MKVKDAGRRAFTLIELMIVVIIVAILAAAAVPIYNSFTSRAYGTEVQTALSTLRTAQRTYKAAHGTYASSKADLENKGYISSSDFEDMKYISYSELTVSQPSSAGDPIASWTVTSGTEMDSAYNYDSRTIDAKGNIPADGSSTDSTT